MHKIPLGPNASTEAETAGVPMGRTDAEIPESSGTAAPPRPGSLPGTPTCQTAWFPPPTVSAVNESGLYKKGLGDWVVNPYIGCEHGCLDCFGPFMPGVKFFNNGHPQEDWGRYLYPKTGFVEALKRQLRTFTPDKAKATEWGNGWILMSFLCDCYTPSEAKHLLTRQCLQLLLEAGHKVRIQTRSALVERDFDLITAHKGQVLLGTSLPYLDDPLARTLEPRASSPTRRIRMLHNARDRGIEVFVAVAPFMPFHGPAVLDEVLDAVAPLDPREIFCEVLNPKGSNIDMMVRALLPAYPEFAGRLEAYSEENWAKYTWEVLSNGITRNPKFIPWPDTGRLWRKHLGVDQTRILDTYLPPKEPREAAA